MSDTFETTPADVEPQEAPQAAATTPRADEPAPVPETANEPRRRFAGYPKRKWHPIHGAKDANDPNEEAEFFDRNWFDTPEAADAARTQREADIVVHRNRDCLVEEHDKRQGVVRNSVAAQESRDQGRLEPI
jgi:hypothetical protein